MISGFSSLMGAHLISAILVISAIPVASRELNDTSSFVALIGDRAYVLGLARAVPVAAGEITDLRWSETGKTVLIERYDLNPAEDGRELAATRASMMCSLMLWNRRTNGLVQVHRYDAKQDPVYDFAVLPDDKTVYIVSDHIRTESSTLTIFTVGRPPEVIKASPGEYVRPAHTVGTSTLMVAFGSLGDSGTSQLSLFNSTTRNWTPIPISLKGDEEIVPIGANDRASYLLSVSSKASKEVAYFRYAISSGKLQLLNGKEFYAALQAGPDRNLPIAAEYGEETLSNGVKVPSIILRGINAPPSDGRPDRPLHFAVGVNRFDLAPAGDGVIYTLDGLLIYRDITSRDRAEYESPEGALTKNQAIHNAKQVGMALLMYAADNDDFLPVGAFREAISPYIKEAGPLDGFIYTYQGGSLEDLKDPGNTPLGFIKGPGGTATVYADGSVRWKNDT